jgi:hypothetical protein
MPCKATTEWMARGPQTFACCFDRPLLLAASNTTGHVVVHDENNTDTSKNSGPKHLGKHREAGVAQKAP